MDDHTLVRHLKELALRIDACRNDIPETYFDLVDAYITIDPGNESRYPSQNQNRMAYPGCGDGITEDDIQTVIDLFKGKGVSHFYIILSPCTQIEEIRSWMTEKGCAPFQGTGYPTLLRLADMLPTHDTELEIRHLTTDMYEDYKADINEIYQAEADQFLFRTSLQEPDFGHFLACDGGRAVAAGMVCLNDEVGYLYSGGTLGSHRGMGAQNALIVARNNFAVERGCRWVSSETLYFLDQSLSNLQRQGFQIVYDKNTYVCEF